MQSINKRMKKIMQEHLLPAGYEFQKVLADFERLSSGKELFDGKALAEMAECDDNNIRYETLKRFVSDVLPHYDDIWAEQSEIRRAVVQAVKKARNVQLRPVVTPQGNLPGKTVADIVEISADIIDNIRYGDIVATFDSIFDLYSSASSPKERERWICSTKTFAEHNMSVWRQSWAIVQAQIAKIISALTDIELVISRQFIVEMLDEVLEC